MSSLSISLYLCIGKPQCGQIIANEDTFPLHSGHLIKAIKTPYSSKNSSILIFCAFSTSSNSSYNFSKRLTDFLVPQPLK